MNITIRIIYVGYKNRAMRRASFPVNPKKFNEDPDKDAVRVAYEWIKNIKKDEHVDLIENVIYNDGHDITDLVKQLINAPIPDIDLPF